MQKRPILNETKHYSDFPSTRFSCWEHSNISRL